VNTVVLPPGLPTDIGFGKDKIGFTEPMKAIVERHGASYAINGTYFSAYGGEPVPYGTLIKDGELVYGGTGGTLIGFETDGRARMEEIRATIEGGTDGLYDSKHRWKASWVNRTGGATTIYTPHRGARIGTSEGVMIVVSGGKVTKVTEKENVKIPQDGFVIVKLRTNLKAEQERFPVGRKVHYRVLYANGKGRVADWSEVVTGVHAWPRLIQDGKLAVKDEKNAERAARSGIGITKDGGVVLATVGRATFGEIAQVLRAKGAVQGMSLDGGASAGIYSQGVMHFTPGRELSHTLMFGANLR
jgi:exopolysaccharide biosynthesis protein